MKITIKNLRVRTIIGINSWERDRKQDVTINIEMFFDGSKAAQTDTIEDTVDYKKVKKNILNTVENSQYGLLERLAETVLTIAMEDQRVTRAIVEIDKPHALRFADSVSITCEKSRE